MNQTQPDRLLQEQVNSSFNETSQQKKPKVDTREVIKEFGVAPGGKPYFQEFKDDLSKMQTENEGNPTQTQALNYIE